MNISSVTVQRYLEKLGVPRKGPHGWLHRKTEAKARADDLISLPQFPDEDISAEEMLDMMAKRFEIRKASHDAHTWFPVTVKSDEPIGILWFGDPHIDDNGCNIPALRRHTELCRATPGLFGANIGDTTNNWAGRLIRLYAEQDTSVKSARKLAKWFMLDSGVRWIIWLIGNHDAWGDGAEVLAQMAKQHGTHKIICHDWEARFTMEFPNGWAPRVRAAHDFPGHSQWNPLHGPMKAGMMGDDAELLVCGDKHNAAVFEFENAARGLFQLFVRVRGYKFMDDYARRLGLPEQQTGCAVLTIFDPASRKILAFSDVESGVSVLNIMRRDHEARQAPAPRSSSSSRRGQSRSVHRRAAHATKAKGRKV